MNNEKKLIIKIATVFLLSALILTTALINVSDYYNNQNIKNTLLFNANEKFEKKSNLVNDFVSYNKNIIKLIKNNNNFKKYLKNENKKNLENFFSEYMSLNEEFIGLSYIDKQGFEKVKITKKFKSKKIVKTKNKDLKNISYKSYFKKSQNKFFGKAWISKINIGKEITVRVLLPIKDEKNSFKGLIVINKNIEDFLSSLINTPIYNIKLFNNNGNIIYSKNSKDIILKRSIKNYFPKDYKSILNNNTFTSQNFISKKFDTEIENGLNIIFQVDKKYLNLKHTNLFEYLLYSLFTLFTFIAIYFFAIKEIIYNYRKANDYQKQLFNESLKTVDEYVLYSKTDLNGKITYVSEGFCNISGYSKEELLGKNHNIVRHPDMKNEIYKGLWSIIKSGNKWSGIIKNRKKNGDYYFVETTIAPEYDSFNRHIGYVSVRKDITNQIKLEKQKVFTESIINNSDSIILTTSGNTLNSINKKFFEIFDYKNLADFKSKHNCICELFVAKDDYFIMPEKNGKSWLEQLKTIPSNAELGVNKICMIDKKGKERIFQIKSSGIVFYEDNLEIITLTEITSILKNRQLLKSQTKHAAMGEMIAMIAHQWRQPLTILTSINSKLNVLYSMNMLTEEKFNDSFNKSKNIINHLSQTINDFRNFFKENSLEEEIKVPDLMNKSIKLIDISFNEHNIKIVENYEDDTKNLTLKLPISKFTQVLLNLLKNASDAIIENNPKEKLIKINTKKVNEILKITIEDTAGGIPKDIIERVFEPYFSTKDLNGTGLGLYMSKLIIEEQLNGEISVKNTQNGALFTIILPKELVKL